MSSSENQGFSMSLASFGRSIWGTSREEVHSVSSIHESTAEDEDLQSFQSDVLKRFHDLSLVNDDEFLSLAWMKKLLDAFLCCQEDFRVLLINNKSKVSKPPLDQIVAEYFDRSVKALDICNATRDGIEIVRQWEKQSEIVLCALESTQRAALGEGQFRRARKALMELAIAMLDEKDSGSVLSQRNRSFGRHNASKDHHHNRTGHSRSLSWSVSRSWSAAKQLQSIANSLTPPPRNEILATGGLAIPVFIMSCVLMFVLWAIVAAIPCQDRSLQCHFSIPRHFSWGAPLLVLHERVIEESKKRERRNSNGLLKEINNIEKCTRHLIDLVESAELPLKDVQKAALEREVGDLSLVCGALKSSLDPLEMQVRKMFRKIMNCRIEGLEFLAILNNPQ
ncbi:hypothetical protein Nepgr_006983 [Nepenthes gracilis]|uniref:Uncharacterized protein n=1 Tax=Nepenthes gracilis TaxID=150966 RepID=A0AAD3XHV6_NEPGR|nr:hypothetical protein Nepgr_006983 [Nepenthes gracilis]